MKALRFAALVGLLPLACAATAADGPPPAQAIPAAEARAPDVAIALLPPAAHSPSLVGAERSPVRIVVTNRGVSPIDVSRLRARLEIAREGVAYRCSEEAPALPFTRDPAVLAPGASWTFERTIDCALPLAGTYDVSLAIVFGSNPGPPIKRDFVLNVTPPRKSEPRRLDDVGLWAVLDATPAVGRASQPTHPQIAIGIVNASTNPVELAPLRVVTRVTRAGSSWSCAGEPLPLAAPAALGAGALHRAPVSVSCLGFDVPGTYDVDVALLVAERAVPLGRLRIEVANHPALLAPPPW